MCIICDMTKLPESPWYHENDGKVPEVYEEIANDIVAFHPEILRMIAKRLIKTLQEDVPDERGIRRHV